MLFLEMSHFNREDAVTVAAVGLETVVAPSALSSAEASGRAVPLRTRLLTLAVKSKKSELAAGLFPRLQTRLCAGMESSEFAVNGSCGVGSFSGVRADPAPVQNPGSSSM